MTGITDYNQADFFSSFEGSKVLNCKQPKERELAVNE
jgi:hypothetical protein